MIRKAVIPAAGLGTRLFSVTKEQPKEMLPVFATTDEGTLCLKPIVQRIFEQLFDFGIREFYFIVGRGKRAIEDHFTPERQIIDLLNAQARGGQASDLEHFYRRIEKSTIVWINQPEPKGFGDAVLQAQKLIGTERFLVHAGDTFIISKDATAIPVRLNRAHQSGNADATLTIQDVDDPRQYGVAELIGKANETLDVKRVVEKPAQPASNHAIMPLYIFEAEIFEALKATTPGKGGEIQLTDAIQRLIDTKHTVQAIKLRPDDVRLDIGTPETYWEAIELSYRHALTKQHPEDD
jgi:UTP--glucose-1-phosphate uridylyltransferase